MYTLASPICVVVPGGVVAPVLLLSYNPTVKVVAAPICGVPLTLFNLNFVPILIGGVFTTLVLLAGIPGQLLGGFIGEKFKKSSIIMILCILHIPFLIIIPSLNGYFLIFYSLILGFINFIFQPIGNSIIADYTSSNERGFAYGFSFFLGFGIGSLGSGIGGILLSNWNISLVFYFAACMMILSIIPSLLLLKVDKKDN